MKLALFIGLLVSAVGVAQPRPMGFLSQDSLLQIYYVPKFRWADSLVRLVRQASFGHSSAEVYRQIKALQWQQSTAPNPSIHLHHTVHGAVFGDETPVKRKKGTR